MGLSVALAAIAAAFVLAPVAAGYSRAMSQDFSITNPSEPDAGRRDLMRQLQAWWDVHGYYPKHASNNDERGNVDVHLGILPDGRIATVDVFEASGSNSIDTAAVAAFAGVFVRPFSEGAPRAELHIALHYVLAHRHDQPVAAEYAPVASKAPFTITNAPVHSPILNEMLQRTCTGKVVKQGIRNHPWYGVRYEAKAIFFRRPDGTPWVSFYEGGYLILAPVTEGGKMVQWTGRPEHRGSAQTFFHQYTLWSDGDKLDGNIEVPLDPTSLDAVGINTGGTVDLTCATEVVPAIEWNSWLVNTIQHPPGDPP